jgi:hypothetical protein
MTEEITVEVISEADSRDTGEPALLTPAQLAILLRIESLARFMDSAVRVPVIKLRFGADSVIGLLLPGIGDVAGALASGYIVLQASKLGLPSVKITRMVSNILVDTGVGIVPFAGDILDIAVKANLKNANLIREHFRLPPLAQK